MHAVAPQCDRIEDWDAMLSQDEDDKIGTYLTNLQLPRTEAPRARRAARVKRRRVESPLWELAPLKPALPIALPLAEEVMASALRAVREAEKVVVLEKLEQRAIETAQALHTAKQRVKRFLYRSTD